MPQTDGVKIDVDEQQLRRAVDTIRRMGASLDERWVKNTHSRNLGPTVNAMRTNSKSTRLMRMIGVTTARRRSPERGARVGVIKNDTAMFPKFSSYGTAAVIEYGTDERFRGLKTLGVVTGAQSTGRMPAAPFLRPAWDVTRASYIQKTERDITTKVNREANQ